MIKFLKPLWILFLLVMASAAHAGDIVDRIVATVNGHIILQSDWEDALHYEAFIAEHSPEKLSFVDRKAVLDRLIDQELLRQQIRPSDFQHASGQEIAARIQEIRSQYPGAESDSGWSAALIRYGLTEKQLKNRVALQLDLLRLVDARLRPTVQIDSKSIESYYNQELLPQLRQARTQQIPLAQASPKIKELLTQRKIDQLLTAWLQTLRTGSEIRTQPAAPDSEGQVR
jgi:peptidyl-prolyl cis-trans isomerase SurA